jgi:hypothetical protein
LDRIERSSEGDKEEVDLKRLGSFLKEVQNKNDGKFNSLIIIKLFFQEKLMIGHLKKKKKFAIFFLLLLG